MDKWPFCIMKIISLLVLLMLTVNGFFLPNVQGEYTVVFVKSRLSIVSVERLKSSSPQQPNHDHDTGHFGVA